jgi:cephalosporin-C deacetylase-like acetyl esterase
MMEMTKRFDLRRGVVLAAWICALALITACAPPVKRAASEEPEIEKLLQAYNYDAAQPLNAEEKLISESGPQKYYHVAYDSTNGERVPALLYVPKKGDGPFPCVIVQHGYGGNKDMGGSFAAFLIPQGFAVFAIDIEYHGERVEPGKDVMSTDARDDVRALSQTVTDLRRAVDYLSQRKDINKDRIGYTGTSLGGFVGAVFAGVEPRIKTAVLIVGGGGWEEMFETSAVGAIVDVREYCAANNISLSDFAEPYDVIEPLNFIGLMAPRPLLMLNCENDRFVPKPTGEALFSAANEPKNIKWFTCDGDIAHIPPMDKALDLTKKWFKKYL